MATRCSTRYLMSSFAPTACVLNMISPRLHALEILFISFQSSLQGHANRGFRQTPQRGLQVHDSEKGTGCQARVPTSSQDLRELGFRVPRHGEASRFCHRSHVIPRSLYPAAAATVNPAFVASRTGDLSLF